MCKKCLMRLGVAGAFMLAAATPLASADADAAKLAGEARGLVKAFGGELKKTLVGTLKGAGPVEAIGVCNVAAPEIAKNHSAASKWTIRRTSLKWRNPDNQPDIWENKVLLGFEEKKKAGADASKLEHFEIVEIDGQKVFRYVKAIVAGKPCLICHGKEIKGKVKAVITEHYPKDNATGFSLGDIRGAFTLAKPLN